MKNFYLKTLLAVSVMVAVSAIVPTTVSAAISDDRKHACFERWNSQILSGNKLSNFNDSNCKTSGYCRIVERRMPDETEKIKSAKCDPDPLGTDDGGDDVDGGDGDGGTDSGTGGMGTIDDCASIKTNVEGLSCDTGSDNPALSLVMKIVNFFAIGVGIAVVGGIVWGALIYTTSNGAPAKTQQGITIIVNSVIALLLFIFTWAIMNFFVPGGVL